MTFSPMFGGRPAGADIARIAAGGAFSTLVQVLRTRAFDQPDSLAYRFLKEGEGDGLPLSYGELDRRARAIGAALLARGAGGQRALLLYPPGLEFIEAFLGCLYAGTVAVPAYPPRLKRVQNRLQAIVREAEPRIALTTSALSGRLRALTGEIAGGLPMQWLATDGVPTELAEQWTPPAIDGDTVAFLQFTSGSTSTPKGVVLTHANLLHNEEAIRQAFSQSADSVIVGWLPLYHDMGLIGNVLQPLYLGATCVLMSSMAFLQRPLRWLEAVSRFRATTSGGPNFAYDLCVNRISGEQRKHLDLSSWTVAFSGAEPVRAGTLDRFAEAFAECGFRRQAFYPCYGLAEATLFVTGGEVGTPPRLASFERAGLMRGEVRSGSPGDPSTQTLVGCGRTRPDQRLAIVDPETGRECPPDRIGEIWVSGPSVASAYWNQPEETRRSFNASLAGGSTDLFLRTGDLGFLQDGELFVAGRLKDLIILRGRNHYPQDIELTVEQSHPALRPGCGAAFAVSIDDEEEGLVVVQEIDRGAGAHPEAVAELIRQRVAEEHEVGLREVVLVGPGAVPRTSSGKVQRYACREAYLGGRLPVVTSSVAMPWALGPGSEAQAGLDRAALLGLVPEEAMALVEAHVRRRLGGILRADLSSIGPERSLAALGVDSLRALELKNALEADLGTPLAMRAFLEDPTLGELASTLLSVAAASPAEREPLLASGGEATAPQPLSYNQKSLWFIELLTPDNRANHIVAAARVRGDLDADRLRRCFQVLVDRHPSLRTTLAVREGEPEQRVHPSMTVDFALEPCPPPEESAGMERLCAEGFRPFDLQCGPLLRVRLFAHPDGGRTLLLAVHHIVVDFWSLVVMLRELGELYRNGEDALPGPPAYRYTDFAAWQRRLLESPEGERLWSYWRQQLAGPLPVLDLPADRPRTPVGTYDAAAQCLRIDTSTSERLRAAGRRHGATLFATLLAAFEVLLYRYTSQEDLLVGSLSADRGAAGLEDVVGYFVNPLALRGDLSGEPTFEGHLGRVRDTVLGALEHRAFPFVLLTERLQPQRDPSRAPLFQTMFLLQKAHLSGAEDLSAFALGEEGACAELGGLGFESVRLARRAVQFDLLVMAACRGDEILVSLQYNSNLFDATTMARLSGHFGTLLAAAARDPGAKVALLPLCTEAERQQVLHEWSDSATDYRSGACLHHLVERHARRMPEATAVVCEGERLTWRELDRRAGGLARRLRALEIGPEMRVAICAERSLGLIVGLLGILKSGGAYLPVDPAYPKERIAFILDDGEARLLLTERRLQAALPQGGPRRIFLDDLAELEGDVEAGEETGRGMSPDHLAYVIYTSGSTGRPKGVQVTHRSAVHLVETAGPLLPPHPREVWTVFHSAAFDFSVWEIWTPLTRGAALVVVPLWRAQSPNAFRELLAAESVTVLHQTPSAIRQLLEVAGGSMPSLRAIGCGGEAFPQDLGQRLLDLGIPIWNFYGPTEATVWCAAGRIEAGEVAQGVFPIGRPLPDARLHVLDERLQPLPVGVPGQLYIGGAGLARGYHRRPALTATSFVPSPFGGEEGARLYRTGDLARHLADGRVEFLGRIDHQVKVRGYRIELQEIEAVLREHPAVEQAVVAVRPGLGGEAELIAYVVPEAAGGADLAGLLRQHLPQYMVPRAIMALARLPLTPNGKVDRRALPVPEGFEAATGDSGDLPRTPTEEVIAGIWMEVLGTASVGSRSHFFDLGGHSLLATRLVLRVQEAFDIDLAVHELFAAPTVAELSARVDEALRARRSLRRPSISRAPRAGLLPLSFAQQSLWLANRLNGGASYNIAGGARLVGDLSVRALAASLNEIVRRHEVLRTNFPAVDGLPAQEVMAERRLGLPLIDLSGLLPDRRDEELGRLARAEARIPFDLASDPLLRTSVLRLTGREHVLLITMHHMVSDRWSLQVLIREMAILYPAVAGGLPSPLPELPVQYGDFAHWERLWLQGETIERQIAFWRTALRGLPGLRLPLDRPRPPVNGSWGRAFPFLLSRELTSSLDKLGRREGATLFMCLLAAADVLLGSLAGQEDIVVGTNFAGRNALATEDLIGLFVNQIVLRADLSGDPTFAELLRRVRGTVLDAYLHQDLPFDRLVGELNPERDPSRPLLFQVKIELESNPPQAPEIPGLAIEFLEPDLSIVRYDLHFHMERRDGAVQGWLLYKPELFDEGSITRLVVRYESLLARAAAEPERRIGELCADLAMVDRKLQHEKKERYQDALFQKLGRARRRVVNERE